MTDMLNGTVPGTGRIQGKISSGGSISGHMGVLEMLKGFSPTVDVVPVPGGYHVTIIDEEETHEFDLLHGIQSEYNAETQTLYIIGGGQATGSQGEKGDSFVGLRYDSDSSQWVYSIQEGETITEHWIDGPAIPSAAADVNAYSKEEVDTFFGSYVNDIAAIVGGDA